MGIPKRYSELPNRLVTDVYLSCPGNQTGTEWHKRSLEQMEASGCANDYVLVSSEPRKIGSAIRQNQEVNLIVTDNYNRRTLRGLAMRIKPADDIPGHRGRQRYHLYAKFEPIPYEHVDFSTNRNGVLIIRTLKK